ncbi:MAG: pyrrolo-quinoline quinone [Verrucomicrobiaceae bacterium]|nr:MAG: pyrrolo-quinoline quinone [Verrucomicrobiaceae bacterium]
MVSEERGLPTTFDPASGENIKWIVPLGSETHSTPVVASGRVYIGTNNEVPRDPKHIGDRGVLLCLNEADGKLLWQLVTPKRDEDQYFDWPKSGISSPATVEGERVYIVSNRGEVLCLDAKGLANGNDGLFKEEAEYMTRQAAAPPTFAPEPIPAGTPLIEPGPTDADILWRFDMPAGVGIWPHDAAHTSILIHGDYVYVNTGTGVDNSHRKIRTPDAPSLIVLEKSTGRLVARDDEHIAPQIFHATWSSPSVGKVNGRELVFFAGGNGILYAFEPVTKSPSGDTVLPLKKVWQFDLDPEAPKTEVHRFTNNKQVGPSNVYGMPVFHENRIYVAAGGDLWWGKNASWLKCIDPKGTGDITKTGLVWSAPLGRHVMSTPAIHDGLVFIADTSRNVHCLDATTGKLHWTHETNGDFWASPLVADGKVYIGTRKGDFWVFEASKEKKILGNIELKRPISATPVAANGVLYIATMKELIAVQAETSGQRKAEGQP